MNFNLAPPEVVICRSSITRQIHRGTSAAGRVILILAVLSQSGLFAGVPSAAAQEARTVQEESKATKPGKRRSKKRSRRSAKETSRPTTPAPIFPLINPAPNRAANPATTPATKTARKPAKPAPLPPQGEKQGITSVPIQPITATVVNFRDLAEQEKLKPPSKTRSGEVIHPPLTIVEPDSPGVTAPPFQTKQSSEITGPLAPSPPPSQNFLAQEDAVKVGTGTFTIPPDTMGAVGLDKVFVTLNNNYRVQNKMTGAPLSTVSIDTFWTSTGALNPFDPRVQYDPYNDRWLVAATSNAQTANSSILVGVSNTSDPEGTWTLFRFIVGCAVGGPGCAAGQWADFPMLGFNKNWIAIGWNQFTINTSAFVDGRMLVLDYPTLLTGTATGTLFSGATAAIGGFCMHPATTFSATEDTLYIPTHISSAGAIYRLHSITGTPAAPTFNVDPANRTRTGGGWTQPGGDTLPQQCIPGVGLPTQTCPASLRRIDSGDAFVRSNVVFRNGQLYYPQTISLPAGTAASSDSARLAAQWTVLDAATGNFVDGGRVEDPTATKINGGKHYAYPSISVNKNNDVLFGFSEFESDDYADAGYTFRFGTDPAGTMRDPVIYKEGEDYYSKTFSGTRNRWGDFSHTVVDPSNDRDLWTIQEYAMLRVGTTGQGSNDSRWGTWWAKVDVSAGPGDLIISEFRLRGPAGQEDEFVELYNATDSSIIVASSDGSAGFGVSDGTLRCTIPNGTTIPARGHFLCANDSPSGYSLGGYAAPDATWNTDIPDNVGIGLFSSTTDFSAATKLDAVGSTSEGNAIFKEGAGLPPFVHLAFNTEHSWYRSYCPGNTAVFGTALGCSPGSGGRPKDSNANENDFVFVDTVALCPFGICSTPATAQRLGAPGPENLLSPIDRNSGFGVVLLDVSVGGSAPPNRVRDLTMDPPNNSSFGTLDVRRRVVNNTGAPVTRLRFRVIDITTFPPTSGFADLRARSSTLVVVSGVNDSATCLAANGVATTPCTVNVQGTTLETPPTQTFGGAFNSSISAGTVTLGTPIAPGASINVRFLLGIQQTGSFRFFLNVEALP